MTYFKADTPTHQLSCYVPENTVLQNFFFFLTNYRCLSQIDSSFIRSLALEGCGKIGIVITGDLLTAGASEWRQVP